MATPKGKVNQIGLPPLKGNTTFPYDYHFSRDKHTAETYESLASQATAQYGLDIYWMPMSARTDLTKRDIVLGEMANKDYHQVHYMRAMMIDINQLLGSSNVYSKFGLILEDSLELFITVRDFLERVGQQPLLHSDSINKIWEKTDTIQCKPEIEDIIYSPTYDSMFVVNFAERFIHMATGYSYGWKVFFKKYNYSTSDSVYINKNQTGFGTQTGLEEDFEKVIDEINSADLNVAREQKRDAIVNPTQTGFDPFGTPDIANDDMSASAIPVKKPGEKDIFSDW